MKAEKPTDFAAALRSFQGYLEGTQKAAHTIKNYRLDVLAFYAFLEERKGGKPVALEDIRPDDLNRFHDQMKAGGLKTNTRRRKLITVKRFLGYLAKRHKVPEELDRKLPTPLKVERIPFTVPSEKLLEKIRELPEATDIEARNRALLWVLAETGCLVSEVTHLKLEYFRRAEAGGAVLEIPGKAARRIPISLALLETVERLGGDPYLFLGFNKFGSMGNPITPRGIELLVRQYALRWDMEGLTPRTFRHATAVRWHAEGLEQDEIQKRLGLKTAYAFRTYAALFKAAKPVGGVAKSTTRSTSTS